ncbi:MULTISPECIES: cation:proton antiporter domain-containing protein [Methylosinus]|uniref:Potassium transporter n=1 Tax=Methylosinus trichosporium (strain ATCC 35070 / NCIMB 11131 / UNIQEM 75 / OB3b) TaxID=595536 RepID=A0A2D2CZM1_METT3|nr:MULTISPECIES: cation:proton antiporter [Methylosinus]ATQ68079.1 potassium transporter [Methylosinus trichosporium OB3b]OBS54358.1 potassium transporter [Methylosinus sp. 3S-1]
MDGLFFQSFVYLCAGVTAVPLAKRFGLGSVLGYLVAGVVIGPLIGIVGAETQKLQEFAEFGVVMMLFLVGLELEPRQLWAMRDRLLGLGGLQFVATALAVCGLAFAAGTGAPAALAIGLMAAGSCTAIVLQTLSEKGLLESDGGKASFAVLLLQDIAVIPTLALLPLLAGPGAHAASGETAEHVTSLVHGLPGWAAGAVTLAAIALVVIGGHFLTRPLFRFIASAQLREMFTATALLLVIGIALLMTLVGLSPALGAFLAGVVLADSEYRHELESDIEPFKSLLLGLFFITVGAGIDFSLLIEHAPLVLGLTAALIFVKAAVLYSIGGAFRLRGADRWLFTLGLAQASEFAFVLLAFAAQNAILPDAVAKLLLLVAALSMLATPLLFILFDRVILPRTTKEQARAADAIDARGVAIIAGIGRFGQIVNRMLRSNGYETVALDLGAATVDAAARFGVKAFFGDAARPDLLEAAGLMEARLLVVAIDDRERALTIVRYAKRVRPDIHIVARAYDRLHVYDLYSAGCDDIIRETFDGAVRAGRSALEALGVHPYEAEKIVKTFVKGDRRSLRKLAEAHDPNLAPQENAAYIALAKQAREEEEEMMSVSRQPGKGATDRAWRPYARGNAESAP